ncbi:hypothetical protein NDU88_004958 [Pleurodeles waltl]|uniref:Uncharacterized protein n=1 Tax=Pleurodeles waltl TaxID=8319 RepID=A0AAV7MZW2_PLEWA|nr:hypothetical protein NDU88_004958 [Pleurodeles waltl]
MLRADASTPLIAARSHSPVRTEGGFATLVRSERACLNILHRACAKVFIRAAVATESRALCPVDLSLVLLSCSHARQNTHCLLWSLRVPSQVSTAQGGTGKYVPRQAGDNWRGHSNNNRVVRGHGEGKLVHSKKMAMGMSIGNQRCRRS